MTTNTATQLQLTKILPASPEEAFAAWTTAADLEGWICPGGGSARVPELDVRPGGRFRIDMIAGDRTLVHTGEYRIVDPPRRLVFTWISDGTNNEESLVTLDFAPHADGTELTLTHEKLPGAESAKNHTMGWQSIVAQLAARLARREGS